MSLPPTPAAAATSADRGAAEAELARLDALVGAVPDPEIPVVTLRDLGILRSVSLQDGRPHVVLTPTYSGCPATEAIRDEVQGVLRQAGHPDARVELTLSPAWTTDWISDDGRRKLREYGIAPPARACHDEDGTSGNGISGDGSGELRGAATRSGGSVSVLRFRPRAELEGPACPQCDSPRVERLAEHGSTPCKALYRCLDCREPFDYFKPY